MNECLKSLHKNLLELLGKQNKDLRRLILDTFTSNIDNIIRGQIMNSFTDLKNRLIGKTKIFFIVKLLGLLKELKSKALTFPDLDDENDLENLKREIYGLLTIFKNKFYVFLCNTLVELKVTYFIRID